MAAIRGPARLSTGALPRTVELCRWVRTTAALERGLCRAMLGPPPAFLRSSEGERGLGKSAHFGKGLKKIEGFFNVANSLEAADTF